MTALLLRTAGAEDTRRLASVVARALRPGDVVSLTGELGAGKTCFVQGAARALGVTARVTSPSFLLRRDYTGDVPVLHIDVYRLERLQEVLDIGYEEASDGQRVTFIEWGDAMSALLPADHLEVELLLPALDASPDGVGPAAPAGAVEGPALQANPEQAAWSGDEPRLVRLRARGDDWRRRLAQLAQGLRPWTEPEGGG